MCAVIDSSMLSGVVGCVQTSIADIDSSMLSGVVWCVQTSIAVC